MEQTSLWIAFQCSFWHSLDCTSMDVRGVSTLVFGDSVSGETYTVEGEPEATRPECGKG